MIDLTRRQVGLPEKLLPREMDLRSSVVPHLAGRRPGRTETAEGYDGGMSIAERVTISIPADLRASAARLADREGRSFSAFVSSAVEDHIRGLLLDEWLAEQAEADGGWDEEDLKALAERTGIPYLPPGRPWSR